MLPSVQEKSKHLVIHHRPFWLGSCPLSSLTSYCASPATTSSRKCTSFTPVTSNRISQRLHENSVQIFPPLGRHLTWSPGRVDSSFFSFSHHCTLHIIINIATDYQAFANSDIMLHTEPITIQRLRI